MNKRNIKKHMAKIISIADEFKPAKTIYIVGYEEVHQIPNAKYVRRDSYNLFTFEDFNTAKEYINAVYKSIVNSHNTFRTILDICTDEVQSTISGDIVYKRTTKIIEEDKNDITQTKLFTLSIETISYNNTFGQ